ncbi:MAG: acyl-CoA dehydrogenase family protein, partial [Schleiferiaceae bacterium]|nr:acyl-CoA dehydrogenase family protein [Schleiferiaceae bacterium]
MEAKHSEELDLIRASAAEFAAQHIAPHVMEWDEAQVFPKELFHEMGRLGFLGVLVSTEYGGAGMGYAEYITIVDEIAQVCGSIGLSVAAHNSLCTQH